jgi:hypothetical protein
MLRGHICIDLHNHKSGFTERYEQDNMLTNAMYMRMGLDLNDKLYPWDSYNVPTAISTYLMPVATHALGGIFLFDGKLTESASNVHFPMDVKLTGWANQTTDTAGLLGGSIVRASSGYTDKTYKNVWNFATAQANGTIASIALTQNSYGPFRLYDSNRSAYYQGYRRGEAFIAFDKANQMGYFAYPDGNFMRIMKKLLPSSVVTIAGPRFSAEEETVASIDMTSEAISYASNWDVSPDYDGYIYLIGCSGNSSGDATVYLRRYKASSDSFSFAEDTAYRKTLTFTGKQFDPTSGTVASGEMHECVSGGYLYCASYDEKSIYKISLTDTTQIKQIIPSWTEFSTFNGGLIFPHRGGGIWTRFYGNGSYYPGFIYPDDTCMMDSNSVNLSMYEFCGYESEDMREIRGDNIQYMFASTNYLGSICNLTEAITKTSTNSMEITYSLTDAS